MLSSIYKSRKKWRTISELKSLLKYFYMWSLIVAPSKNGEQFKPNTTEVKRFTATSGSFSTKLLIYRNLRKSLSSSTSLMFKNAALISLVNPYLYALNLTKMSSIFGSRQGPAFKNSLREGPFLLALDFCGVPVITINRSMRDVMNCTWRPWVTNINWHGLMYSFLFLNYFVIFV